MPASAPPSEPPTASDPFVPRLRRFVLLSVLLISILALYLYRGKLTGVEYTDNAKVYAHVTSVQPQVSGYVKLIAVDENQPVKRGDTVIRFYTDHFEAIVAERQARLEVAEAALKQSETRVKQQKALISAAKVDADLAAKNHMRAKKLLELGSGSEREENERFAVMQRSSANLIAANLELTSMRSDELRAHAEMEAAKASLRLAELDVTYSHIWAADDGIIADKNVEVGEWISPGTEIFRIVSDEKWIVANFKETQIANMHSGQRADIRIDAYPDQVFCGEIDSFSPATGAVFSLTPPDNATGNFTKIVQRVPVKILFKDSSPLLSGVKAGLSATVSVKVDNREKCPSST